VHRAACNSLHFHTLNTEAKAPHQCYLLLYDPMCICRYALHWTACTRCYRAHLPLLLLRLLLFAIVCC
jgi:hypothetical protein